MAKFYSCLLALSVAAASLSSCSSAHYAFQGHTPAYLGVTRTVPATNLTLTSEEDQAEGATASATEDLAPLASVSKPAQQAAALLAQHRVAPRAMRPAPAPEVAPTAAEPARAVAPALNRKALKQELKRHLAASQGASAEGKSQLVALLLCLFLGGLGIHDFYLGYIGKGILQIALSLIVIGFILVIIDFVRIFTGSLKPKGGEYAKKL